MFVMDFYNQYTITFPNLDLREHGRLPYFLVTGLETGNLFIFHNEDCNDINTKIIELLNFLKI